MKLFRFREGLERTEKRGWVEGKLSAGDFTF